jgi:hypothetical protein
VVRDTYPGPLEFELTFRVERQSDVPKILQEHGRGRENCPAHKEVLADGLELVARVPTTRVVVCPLTPSFWYLCDLEGFSGEYRDLPVRYQLVNTQHSGIFPLGFG